GSRLSTTGLAGDSSGGCSGGAVGSGGLVGGTLVGAGGSMVGGTVVAVGGAWVGGAWVAVGGTWVEVGSTGVAVGLALAVAPPVTASGWATDVRLLPLPAQPEPERSAKSPPPASTNCGSANTVPDSATLPARPPVRCRQLLANVVLPPPVGR